MLQDQETFTDKPIFTISDLREKLAVLEDWKPIKPGDPLVIREYVVLKDMPFPDFNGIAFIGKTDKTKLIICNPDSTEKFIISPPDFVQTEEYEKRDFHHSFFDYPTVFERFDDYFEYNTKKYLTVKISKYENDYHDLGISQLRYLDIETREFLPFTKTIFITTTDFESRNPHITSRNQKIDL